MEKMISAFRNNEEFAFSSRFIRSNKLLLLNIRHIRRESAVNLQAPSLSYIRINDAITLDNADSTNMLCTKPLSRGLHPKKHFLKNRVEGNNEVTTKSLAGKFSSSKVDLEIAQKGSLTKIPESDSSGSFVYGVPSHQSLTSLPHASQSPTQIPRSFSRLSTSSLSQQSHSFTSRSLEDDWTIPSRTKLQILFYRIVYCLQRNPFYLYLHNAAAVLVAISLGIFFWQLRQDSMGMARRYSLLTLIVLYLTVQGYSGRLWFQKDRDVLTRDIRCGFYSPFQYFSVFALLDATFDRFLPTIFFVAVRLWGYLKGLISVFMTGMCRTDDGFSFSKIMLYLLVCFVAMTLFTVLFAVTCTVLPSPDIQIS